ncbi:MAG TPA: ABC transporter permease [Gemmatimonadaceae bacterium]|nr:ABC transporter permease [Gemmatimonadaceae bacterium]
MSGLPQSSPTSRLARAIVRLYPERFRAEYGEEMARFIDDLRSEPRFRGGRGRAALFAHLALDSAWSAAREHWRALAADRRATGIPPHMQQPTEEKMDTLLQDLRYAARSLGKRPMFVAIAVLTLTLGIGANTAIFSVVDAVLLRPLPFPGAQRLTTLWGQHNGEKQLDLFPIKDFEDIQARNHTFEEMGLARSQSVNLTGTEAPDRLIGEFTTASTFRLFGARAAIGRLFTDEETAEGTGQRVAVISYAVWKNRFGGDPSVVGRTLTLDGRPHVVIGVTDSAFNDPFGSALEVWLPITSAPQANWFERGNGTIWGFGRLKPGVTLDDAKRDVAAISKQLEAEYPQANAGRTITILPLKEYVVGDVRPILLIILAFVGVVLLIACANVANLQLARAASRTREMALRAALGAGRSRLVRQLLTENLLLSVVGGAAAILFAHWVIGILVKAIPGRLPTFGAIGVDNRVLAFSILVTVGAGLLFGAAPAIRAARADLAESLSARASDAGRGGRVDARSIFVGVQLALSIMLLVGAGLLTRSLSALQRVNPGYATDNLLTAEFRLPAAKYTTKPEIRQFMSSALDQIRAVPGVKSAALVQAVPLSGNWGNLSYATEAQGDLTAATAPTGQMNIVSDGYFRTMDIPMFEGRDFDSRDREGGERVAIVNRELAQRAWPGESAIGKRLKVFDEQDVWVTVVGVVGNVKHLTLGEPMTAQLYAPMLQEIGIFNSVVARTTGDPMTLAPKVREAIWSVDRDQPVWKLRSMEFLVARDVATPSFTTTLTGSFALLALLLAAVGVYGVMSFTVALRTRELGIRMALGAQRATVVRLVLRRGLTIVAIALATGLIGSFAAARLLRNQLFGVTATDPVTYVAVPLLLVGVALLACYLPARRAAKVDPVIALRSE